jgi:hypothetical protein
VIHEDYESVSASSPLLDFLRGRRFVEEVVHLLGHWDHEREKEREREADSHT